LIQSAFVPGGPDLIRGTVVEPLPNGLFRVELQNGAKVLAHVADRVAARFPRLRAGDKVKVELADSDNSRARIKEIER
jgi:translation initiation factor IF-1